LRRIAFDARSAFAAALCAWLVGACATPQRAAEQPPTATYTARPPMVERALGDRILALDPGHVSDDDVRTVLGKGPAPHIIAIHGGVYPVQLVMESFARFLMRMGYPESALRDAGDGALSQSPYADATRMAGEIAWYYERDGMPPMLVGHSQGGIHVVKILHALAGAFDHAIPVCDPAHDVAEERTTIVDPLTGATRPVVGITVHYASVVGAGGAALLLPNQWSMAQRLHHIPDTVVDFTGFTLRVDLIAWDSPESRHAYEAMGTAHVRNVLLPAAYSHVFVANTEDLGENAAARAWINAYTPDLAGRKPPPAVDLPNILWAADVWYSIKKAWVSEVQALVRAQRASAAG
jgi:hypothetical protein